MDAAEAVEVTDAYSAGDDQQRGDGLASGLSGVACGFYALEFLQWGMYAYSALAAATLGTLLPFFFFNVFGNARRHRKIFMGDTGALVIGLMLAVMAMVACGRGRDASGASPAVMAFAPLLVPGFDVVRVYVHRIRAGRNPFLPDKTHIHHKLLALGMTQRQAMVLIVASSTLLTAVNCLLTPAVDVTLLFLGDLAAWTAANVLLTRAIRRRERRLGTRLFD